MSRTFPRVMSWVSPYTLHLLSTCTRMAVWPPETKIARGSRTCPSDMLCRGVRPRGGRGLMAFPSMRRGHGSRWHLYVDKGRVLVLLSTLSHQGRTGHPQRSGSLFRLWSPRLPRGVLTPFGDVFRLPRAAYR